MRADDFRWWIARVASTLQTVDVVRIDHFRGFADFARSSGEIDKTAERWMPGSTCPERSFLSPQSLARRPRHHCRRPRLLCRMSKNCVTALAIRECVSGEFAFGGDAKQPRSAAQLYQELHCLHGHSPTTIQRSVGTTHRPEQARPGRKRDQPRTRLLPELPRFRW